MIKRIYLGGALAGAADLQAAKKKYIEFAKALQVHGFEVHVPFTEVDSKHLSPEEIFDRDSRNLLSRDAFVAFIDEPSHGVGSEATLSAQVEMPIIGLYRDEATTSLFLMGLIKSTGIHNRLLKYEHGNWVELAQRVAHCLRDPDKHGSDDGDKDSISKRVEDEMGGEP